MNLPLVSIAIITYNQRKFLADCIASCCSQDYPNLEIVVADDCSTDGTRDLLDRLCSEVRGLRVVHASSNGGIAKNCSNAWKHCSGEWIKSIAGDDILVPGSISQYMSRVLNDDAVHDVYFASIYEQTYNSCMQRRISTPFFDLTKSDQITVLCRSNPFFAPASFISRKALISVGFADERYPMLEDYPLWLRLVDNGFRFCLLSHPAVIYQIHEGNISIGLGPLRNLRYAKSLFDFQRNELWPRYCDLLLLKRIDDTVVFAQALFVSSFYPYCDRRLLNSFVYFGRFFKIYYLVSTILRHLRSLLLIQSENHIVGDPKEAQENPGLPRDNGPVIAGQD